MRPPVPKLGTRERREAVSAGQPQAASIEPGPLEVAEEERAQRDDAIRESMAEQAAEGGRAIGDPELAPGPLSDAARKHYRLVSGQYNFIMVGASKLLLGENSFAFPEEIPAGRIFIVRAIRAIAPKGTGLQLFLNNLTPTSLIEVITNIQLASIQTTGPIRIVGPARVLAKTTGTEAEGPCTLRLEGDNVDREPVPQ